MAAYAALVSLMNTIDNIHNHPRLSVSLDKYQIESLGEKLDFLLGFVESCNNSHGGVCKEEAEDLESQIAAAAQEAEDVIESHIVDQIIPESTEIIPHFNLSHLRCLFGLQKVILDMDSVKEKVMKVKEESEFNDHQLTNSMPAASSRPPTTGKTTMVGFDGYLLQLLERLTGQQSHLQIIPIVGMGGIGKTTLARNVYENSLIVQHFYVCAWVTVSQEYNVREILLGILSCLRESTGGMDEKTEVGLGEQLYKILFDRRYLIILDDMWSIDAWRKVKSFFPENYNKSRIVVTTRQLDVANHIGSSGLALNFLDDDESWDLFCKKAFAQESCPPELEKTGRNIVRKCQGLPLSIVVVGGLLGKSSRTQEYWESVEKDLISILNSAEDNQCFNILSLSYSHLPACLKPCFLYLGTFSEDHEIRVSELVKLWVAEGFIKPNRDQSLEEVAEEFIKANREQGLEEVAKGYIKDLIDRNLILVHELGMNGKFKTCKIHDLLRDLCIKVAKKEKFFCLMRELDTPLDINTEHRIVIHGSVDSRVFHAVKSASLARSVIGENWCKWSPKSRLLRVLYNAYADSDTMFQQVNLRFLLFCPISENDRSNTYKLPSSISLLWNLQTLAMTGTVEKVVAPSEIWEMAQLRHLEFMLICLPDPPPSDKEDGVVLENLQTLGRLLNFKCSEEACKRMPNLKKLHISYDDLWGEGDKSLSEYCLYNVGRLNKLESLDYYFQQVPNRDDLLHNLRFPRSLKKLVLRNCGLHWNDLRIIGSLPRLEVLRLGSVDGYEWNPVEGEFLHLKYLGIYWCSDLIFWNVDRSHFPVLEKLDLSCLKELEEIPSGMGDISTLEVIYVDNCSISTAISAMKILEEQESLGNQSIQVQVKFCDEREAEEFREKVEKGSFTCLNFQLILVDE